MKRASIIILLLSCTALQALEVPRLGSRVNDYAGMLSPATVQDLEARLADLEKTDSTQIAVLTVPSLEGEVLEEFSIKVADSWKIGQRGKDNGAILLIARDDRKLRIEVGRGLEGKLTDLMAGRIIRDEITPRFRAGDFDGGVSAGVNAMIATVRGEYVPGPDAGDGGSVGGHMSISLLVTLFFFIIMAGAISRILGGLMGGLGLAAAGFLVFPGIGVILLAVLGGVGFVLGLLLSIFAARRGGGRGIFTGGGFGGFSGGGFSSGGSSFGGFSGGGGSFGGGGSSGGW
ncbi:MAG: TPM domain-containing protein [Spirochaetes bacterium]|nr:TPM domain-containing protein [Spirochaetota bacterium]